MKKSVFWLAWILVTLLIAGFYNFKIFIDEDKEELLIGEATHGHFQIELACSSCHSDAFSGPDVIQDACLGCHAEELKESQDSHPKSKFRDPRNAERLAGLDARYCVSCHTEHQSEVAHPMGLTLPEDYCFHCHQEVGEERPSHEGLGYDTCASSGCHNYHDNRALYEPFLVKNSGGHWLSEQPHILKPNHAQSDAIKYIQQKADSFADKTEQHPEIAEHWGSSSHAEAGINCGGCHNDEQSNWIEKPGIEQCSGCHQTETAGFMTGKHGMRLAEGLTAISPAEGRLSFTEESLNVSHSCTACHGAHDFNTEYAATEACLTCHNDEHSLAFKNSPHGLINNISESLLQTAQVADLSPDQIEADQTSESITDGQAQEFIKGGQAQEFIKGSQALSGLTSNVSCATCHMPRIVSGSEEHPKIRVEHNQNMNLRPNEKMIRSVCMHCHNLEFSIDALADPELIKNNFNGKPSQHIPSIDWALKEAEKK